jgi:hypothetical protein
MLTIDDFDFIIPVVADASQDILQKHEAKQEEMYDRIEVQLKGVQQALQSNCAVSTAPPLSEAHEFGDEPTQIHRPADATEAHLRRAQEETEHATEALNKLQKLFIEQRRVAQQEKDSLQTKFEEEKVQIQQEKEKLLVEQVGVKEAVSRAFHSDRLREKRGRPSGTSSRSSCGSYPTTSTENCRPRATNSAKNLTGCVRSTRSHCPKHSREDQSIISRMKIAKCS